jgi:hypothetical protein
VCRILVSASFQVCACPRPESASNF